MAADQDKPRSDDRGSAEQGAVPTLADVARQANVSTATVSRCLNAPDRVVAETRERVLKAVAELGYAPNFGARALAARQTNTVGAVIPTMENAVFARGIQAFQEELVRHGKTLLIASSGYDAALEDEQVRNLVARGADALLLIGYDRSADLYRFLERRGIPTLVTWSYSAQADYPSVGFDNRTSMAALARRVIDLGHRKIACISAPIAENDRARERIVGIRQAMREAGLDPESLAVTETPYGVANGETALLGVLDRAPGTTAVMCGNDVLAVGALRGAKQLGLRVPDDLSVTGFDDIEVAQLAEPELATVHVPHREMGRLAGRVIIEMLRDGVPPQSVALATELRMRGSLGPARGS